MVWLWANRFGCIVWTYGLALGVSFGFGRMVLGVWFWAYGFAGMVLGLWLWAYGLALGVWWGFGHMVLGVWL